MDSAPDPAILSLLRLDPANSSMSGAGGMGMSASSTSKVTTMLSDGTSKDYFVKTVRHAREMVEGEHYSLTAIHDIVPTLCPKSYGYGECKETSNRHFLVTDYLDLSGRGSGSGKSKPGTSLAEKLAKLHSAPAPVPEGYDKPQFGFPVPTCCGDTPQDNTFESSWADFYTKHRLQFITKTSEKRNGKDADLEKLVEQVCSKVVPRLIGDDHLNGGKGVTPVVIHGDLWTGNASKGKLPGMSDPEDLVFDSSACYAHNEFELGIMRMFGGFGGNFTKDYHALVPKSEPFDEYEDRIKLYELYHHLNHHSLFGGGYRGGAVSIMKELIKKYGKDGEHSEL